MCNENDINEKNSLLSRNTKYTLEAMQTPFLNFGNFDLGQRFHKLHESIDIVGLKMYTEPLWNFLK